MSINEIIDQMESGLEVALPGPWVFHPDTMRAIIAHIRELEARSERAEAKVTRLREALGDLLSWFPDEQPKPKWELPAGEHGADDAIEAALKAMEATDE